MIKNITTSLLALALLCACSPPKTADADGFVEVEKISGDSIVINEILEPGKFVLTKDYALIASPKSNKVMYRYSLPDWEFVDTTFSKGQGPADMLNPIFQPTNKKTKDKVWISDPQKEELRVLRVDDDSPRVVSTISTKKSKKKSFWYSSIVDDRYLLDTKIDYDIRREYLYTFDIKDSLKIVDSLLTLSVWDVEVHGKNTIYIGKTTASIVPYGDKIFCFIPELGNVMIYSISADGKFSYLKTLGKEYTYEQITAMGAYCLKSEWLDVITITDKHIYYSYSRFEKIPDPQDPNRKKTNYLQSEIRVYDHDMNPVKKFILHNPCIDKILIDEDRGMFYAWDGSQDFEQVYVYKYKL